MSDGSWTDHVPWWVVPIISAIPGGLAFYAARVDRLNERKKTLEEDAIKAEGLEADTEARERAQLSKDQMDMRRASLAEIERLQTQLKYTEENRVGGWDCARAWQDKYDGLRRRYNTLISNHNVFREEKGASPLAYLEDTPGLEEIPIKPLIPKKAST